MFRLLALLATAAGAATLPDKLQSPFSSDCFKRISIGQRMISYDVTRTVRKNTVKGCEDECNIYECTFFSFGIGTAGNGTCELSTIREISKRQATDYDLYQRTKECSQGKPTGYEEVCYRRLVGGRRLDERFIRHSLPCDTLEACQHQCSIEKHFECQGFNIRPSGPGSAGGICELSSIPTAYLNPSRDFRFDPEFDYYERDHGNRSPNCGTFEIHGGPPRDQSRPPAIGGPYRGGDSYGPWSSGYGGPEHGPWGSHGYGSGSYVPNNPGTVPPRFFGPFGGQQVPRNEPYGPAHPLQNNLPAKGTGAVLPPGNYIPGSFYGWGRQPPTPDFRANEIPYKQSFGPGAPQPFEPYPGNRRYSSNVPSYVILDSEPNRRPYRPGNGGFRPSYPREPQRGGGFRGFPDLYSKEVCFQRAHVGYKLDPKFVKDFHSTSSVLDCEAMCTKSNFPCTGYSYRYSSPGTGEPNCALTDYSPSNWKHNLLPDRSCDFYYKMPVCSSAPRSDDAECFLKTFSNQRIAPDKVRNAIFVRGVSDCELECLKSYHFTCRSFTFRYGPTVIGEPAENCFLSDWPVRDLHPSADYVPGPGCEVYERGSYGHGCELDSESPSIGLGFNEIGYPKIPSKNHWNPQEMWRHFTVHGWPCRTGTQCQLNREAGFWSCEVEGGDREQWDYCCRPGRHCGFSRGFYYPWCYVGEAGPDQWRPCSEQFYPDFGSRPPGGHSSALHSGGPHDLDKGNRPWNYGLEEYGPPSYWPVLYLYSEPPPNVTEGWTYDEEYHHLEEDPKIQFRPSKNKISYPKGIVLKIDVKDGPPAGDPGYEAHKHDDHYHYRKNLVERVPVNDLKYPFYQNHNCEKQNLVDASASSTTPAPGKRESWRADKSKEVIRDVEKIIEDKLKEESPVNETLIESPIR